MKLLSIAQLREADAFTIQHEPIASIDLMERAATRCVEWLRKVFPGKCKTAIVCGNGNNGGDGLAIARMLIDSGWIVEVYLLRISSSDSRDFSTNLQRLKQLNASALTIAECNSNIDFPAQDHSYTCIIDALFGTGLNRPAEGLAMDMINHINLMPASRISIDVPSGFYGDDNRIDPKKAIVQAAHTLSFQQPKLAFLFAENERFTGRIHILDIGLHQHYIDQAISRYAYIDAFDVYPLLTPRKKFDHKGTYGHALLVAGSRGKIGAAQLAVRAALRSGVGLVTAYIPRCANTSMQAAVPEAMLLDSEDEDQIAGRITQIERFAGLGFGPGVGTDQRTAQTLKLFLQEVKSAPVLDADALNILAENRTWLSFLPAGTILTPHPGEFDRLTGKHTSGHDRLETQIQFAQKFNVYIVLKGANTSIACPDGRVFFNSTGNPGMAKGGTGDVLTGLLTGLRAKGYDPLQAAVLGVYLHGLAGDLAAEIHGEEAMTSGDLIWNIGAAFVHLQNLPDTHRYHE